MTRTGLAIAAVISLLGTDLLWHGSIDLAEVVGVLLTLGVFGGLLHLALGGVDPRRGALVLFVVTWGGLVLITVAGGAVESALRMWIPGGTTPSFADREVPPARADDPVPPPVPEPGSVPEPGAGASGAPYPDPSSGAVGGGPDDGSAVPGHDGPEAEHDPIVLRGYSAYAVRTEDASDWSLFPSGSGAVPLALGWIAGLGVVVAFRRTLAPAPVPGGPGAAAAGPAEGRAPDGAAGPESGAPEDGGAETGTDPDDTTDDTADDDGNGNGNDDRPGPGSGGA